MERRKPKIGLLGLITGGYESIFPGILKRQEAYAGEIAASLEDVAHIVFEKAGTDRATIEGIVEQYNRMELDGMLIVLLAYYPGAYLTRALQKNRLPIAMAVVQPDQEVLDDWEELDFTVNQGIHGAQDNANTIHRLKIACSFFVGNRNEERFRRFVEDFAKACYARAELMGMRVGVFSRMCGMGDILADDMAFYKKIGPEICHDTIGSIVSKMKEVNEREIEEEILKDHERFEIDPNLSRESHEIAVREYLGFKRYLEETGYRAYTAHFDQFAADGRFRQLPLYAASRLLAEGYGYAAEGDFICACMVAAAHALGENDGNFTEMYTMDFVKQAIIFCHAGEGNWSTVSPGKKPRLIDRYLGEGGLENPPTILFTPRPGRATLVSLVAVEGEKFRLIIAEGEILEKSDLRRCEMPYFFWRPDAGLETCVEKWLENGGTHHEVINLGDVSQRWILLAKMLGIEYVEI
ncbi:MAG: arabinose isomerase [Clostridiales bacterium]|nr:MAG: arabinose isomerase [Clostridiales bacterium]HJA31347.1 arabinose isomerase [Candidatus Eisenbergiella pullicola]